MPNQDPSAPFRIRQAVLRLIEANVSVGYPWQNADKDDALVDGIEEAAQAVTDFILAEYADGPGVDTEEEPEEGYIARQLREARERTAIAQEETGQTPAPEWAYSPNDPEAP